MMMMRREVNEAAAHVVAAAAAAAAALRSSASDCRVSQFQQWDVKTPPHNSLLPHPAQSHGRIQRGAHFWAAAAHPAEVGDEAGGRRGGLNRRCNYFAREDRREDRRVCALSLGV
jgi:hypothetical protein